jgi:hypothetical protein
VASLDRVGEFIDNSLQNANLLITERGQFRDALGSAIARLAYACYGCKVISNHAYSDIILIRFSHLIPFEVCLNNTFIWISVASAESVSISRTEIRM